MAVNWHTDAMPQDGSVIYRRVLQVYRYQPYSPRSQVFKRGLKGRWQEMNEYGGFQNCRPPLGNEWCTEEEMQGHFAQIKGDAA